MIKKDIKEFITGKYYRYLGNAQRINWATDGEMNFALDGEWRECLMGYNTEAKFKDIGSTCLRSKRLWSWVDGLELWEESDFPMGNQVDGHSVDLSEVLVSCPKNKPSVFIKKRRKLVYIKIKD